jgi:transcriptional regulator with XRE-family HTH domain
MGLGDRIKYVRKLNKLSQAEFAHELEVDRSHISKLESGAILPSMSLGLKIIFGFDINPDWFLDGAGEIQKKWGSKDLRRFYESGIISHGSKAMSMLNEKIVAVVMKLADILGDEVFELVDPNLEVDDPIVYDTVKRIYLRIEAAASKSKAVKKKQEIEAAILRLLNAMEIDSRKDIFALLLSKAARLPLETQNKLHDDLRCLQEAEREEENS